MKICLRLLASVFFSAVLFVFAYQDVLAIDNPDISDTCQIRVGKVSASSVSNNLPAANASGIESDGSPEKLFWNVAVTLGPDAAAHFKRCGGSLMYATQVWEALGPWNETILSGSGSNFTGRVVLYKNNNTTARSGWDIDIELKEKGNCESNEPICKRMYVSYVSDEIDDDANNCNSKLDDLAIILNDQKKRVKLGDSISYKFTVTEDLKRNCDVFKGAYEFVRLDTEDYNRLFEKEVFRTPKSFSAVDVSHTPDKIGRWAFFFSLYKQGTGYTSGAEEVLVRTYRSEFCVSVDGTCSDIPTPKPDSGEGDSIFYLCQQISIPTDSQQKILRQKGLSDQEVVDRVKRLTREKKQCCECAGGQFDEGSKSCAETFVTSAANQVGIYTAVGCIGSDTNSIVTSFVRLGVGIAGGVALLMILAGGFMFTTSQGEPKRAGEAKDLITSAVMGLLFIIFSVAILQFIGISILKIPGFGR